MTDKIIISINTPNKAIYFLEQELQKRKGIYWTMKNGDLINISEMSESHIINTLSLLERQIQLDELIDEDLNYGD